MPACRTPLLRPDAWRPSSGSFSRTTMSDHPAPASSRASVSPMMPPPTTRTLARSCIPLGLRLRPLRRDLLPHALPGLARILHRALVLDGGDVARVAVEDHRAEDAPHDLPAA